MNKTGKMIRILPMNFKEEFQNKSIETVQKTYFLDELVNENRGVYLYKKSGIKAEEGDFVLFQVESKIIASAIFQKIELYKDKPVDGKYYGGIFFYPDSVMVFDPITENEFKNIVDEFKIFSNVKQAIDPKYYDELTKLIEEKTKKWKINNNYNPNTKYIGTEGSEKWLLHKVYERDLNARKECINLKGTICYVCNFDFGKFYGQMGEGFIHVHHTEHMSSQKGPYQIEPEKDLVPVCPNCHAMLHSNYYGENITVEKLKSIILKNMNNN